MSKTLRFNFDHVLEQWLTGEKREAKREILRLEYFENEKVFTIICYELLFGGKNKQETQAFKISKLFIETRSNSNCFTK